MTNGVAIGTYVLTATFYDAYGNLVVDTVTITVEEGTTTTTSIPDKFYGIRSSSSTSETVIESNSSKSLGGLSVLIEVQIVLFGSVLGTIK